VRRYVEVFDGYDAVVKVLDDTISRSSPTIATLAATERTGR